MADQIFCFGGNGFPEWSIEGDIGREDLLGERARVEGEFAGEDDEEKDAERPHVL